MPRCCGKTPPIISSGARTLLGRLLPTGSKNANAKREVHSRRTTAIAGKGVHGTIMYIRTLGHFSDDKGKYQSEDAARRAADDMLKKYEASSRGVDVPKRLTRQKRSLVEEAALLQRRIKELPKLYQDKAALDRRARIWQESREKNRVFSDPVAERWRIEEFVRRTGALSPDAYRIELAKLLVKLGYPPDYLLRDLEPDLRRARCEDSLNALRFAFPCGGMEVDDPEGVSQQVADHYMQTELGSAQVDQRAACSLLEGAAFATSAMPEALSFE